MTAAKPNWRLKLPALVFTVLTSASAAGAIHHCPRDSSMPEGYRLENYRRPTPNCVPDGVTVSTNEVVAMLASPSPPLLIDVWALLLRSEPGFGHEWLPTEVHMSLPGAMWLPNVGYGVLKTPIDRWFPEQLHQLTQGDKERAMVLFCVADCWMSWNAAIRARELGYTQVYWYKDGTSGWHESGRSLVPTSPLPIH